MHFTGRENGTLYICRINFKMTQKKTSGFEFPLQAKKKRFVNDRKCSRRDCADRVLHVDGGLHSVFCIAFEHTSAFMRKTRESSCFRKLYVWLLFWVCACVGVFLRTWRTNKRKSLIIVLINCVCKELHRISAVSTFLRYPPGANHLGEFELRALKNDTFVIQRTRP